MSDKSDWEQDQRLWPAMKRLGREIVSENFEGLFVIATLIGVGAILYFLDQKLSFLNLFFIPVLVAGCFMNTRSAVMGGLLAIAWVTFFVVLDPDSFSQEMGRMGLYLHLLIWASFLILTGAIVGRMTERLRGRYMKTRDTLEELANVREDLVSTNERLEERNLTLEVTRAKVESVLYSTMDPLVAKLIIDRKLRNEKRSLTVLFADLANFTQSAEERPPESVIEELNDLFSQVEPILTTFRGHLDKYIGDGLMAEFGVPFPSQNHSLNAVLAALWMQTRLKERRFPGKLRVGIASGPAIVGLVGSEHRKNYTAIGDTVNLASRLQALCPVDGVCIDHETYEAVQRWFHIRRIREGLSSEDAKQLEARLRLVRDTVEEAPTYKLCVEAANIASELGDMDSALKYHRQAVDLAPEQRKPIERAIASAMLTGEERGFVTVKGKKKRIAVYQVTALKDPLEEGGRVPAEAMVLFSELAKDVWLPEEHLLAVEAAEGAIGHAKVTAALSACAARRMGLDDKQIRDCLMAGYLHDIGKRNVPEYLLACESQMRDLPAQDQQQLRAHVQEAEKVIADWGLPRSAEILKAIAEHHERYDGSGYPHGRQGEDISLIARIIQIADTYETLTSWRPHQEALTPRAALKEIQRDMNEGRFDSKIGDVFLKMMEPLVGDRG